MVLAAAGHIKELLETQFLGDDVSCVSPHKCVVVRWGVVVPSQMLLLVQIFRQKEPREFGDCYKCHVTILSSTLLRLSKTQTTSDSRFLERESSDHGLSFGRCWGRGRRGASHLSCNTPGFDAWNRQSKIMQQCSWKMSSRYFQEVCHDFQEVSHDFQDLVTMIGS